MPRTKRLSVTLDLRYIGIVDECYGAMLAIRGTTDPRVFFSHPRGGCVVVQSLWVHWPCLFPQHGPGKKHERDISLEPWQGAAVELHPWSLIRGLIHSDGWRGENPVRSKAGRTYSYPRYQFTNKSQDIRQIFEAACARVGLHTSRTGDVVYVSRRADVARLDRHVGPKT